MGASNLSIHSQKQINIALISKVFSHPARISILQYISKYDSCICDDIVNNISLSQPTITQHLQVIRNAGLLTGSFNGKTTCYSLNVNRFIECQELLNSYFNTMLTDCS